MSEQMVGNYGFMRDMGRYQNVFQFGYFFCYKSMYSYYFLQYNFSAVDDL